MDDGDGVSDDGLDADRAREILNHLSTYATVEHAVWVLLAAFGGRRGTIRAIDLEDSHLREEELDDGEKPYIELKHRPEQGTPLKTDDQGAYLAVPGRMRSGTTNGRHWPFDGAVDKGSTVF